MTGWSAISMGAGVFLFGAAILGALDYTAHPNDVDHGPLGILALFFFAASFVALALNGGLA